MPPVRAGVWVKVRVSFRVRGQPGNCPRGKLPPVRIRVWVRVSFLGRNCPKTLLDIKFNSSLSFEGQITSLCKRAIQKLHALARIVNSIDLPKRKVFLKHLPHPNSIIVH